MVAKELKLTHSQLNLISDPVTEQASIDQTSQRKRQPRSRNKSQEQLRDKPLATDQYISSIWSFPGSGGEQLYRWYGTLPRPLVERIISLYAGEKNSLILDTFMGMGVTLDVAADFGMRGMGLDSNALACLAAEARLFGIPSRSEVMKTAYYVAQSLPQTSSSRESEDMHRWADFLADEGFSYTRKWFRIDTLASVLDLLSGIADVEDVRIQRYLFVAAAQIIRDVASVDPRCTHHLVTKQKPFINPIPLWLDQVSRGIEAIKTNSASPDLISVSQGSTLSKPLENESANLVLAHPPYLGVIHYHLIHRLASDLLDYISAAKTPASLQKYDFNYKRLKEADVSTDNSDRYLSFIKQFASIMNNVVTPGGRCVIIIGDQRYKGHLRHPFTDFIQWFEQAGFTLEELFIWILQNNGGMHILRRGHFIDHNYILVFHKTNPTLEPVSDVESSSVLPRSRRSQSQNQLDGAVLSPGESGTD
jgi:DNA modification methylase